MKNLVVISIIGFVVYLNSAFAQQDPLFSQYRFDRLVINPAYAGSANSITGTLGYRQQFVGLDGAPVTQVFGIHSPILKKSMGIGLKVIHDKIGVTEQTSIAAIYAYHLRLARGKLSFGLEGGLLNQSTDFPVLIKTDADDPLLQNKESIMLPDAAFGVYYHTNKFFLGASMYHLLQGELNYTGSPRTPIARLFNHSFLTGGYSIDAGENIQLEPSLLLKYVSGAPVQTDINMNITFKEMFTLGGGYRTSDAIVFLFKYSFKDRINIGYAYDYTISKLAPYNNGSHEIMLSYNIKLKEPIKKPVEPIYEEIIAEVSPDKLYLVDQNGDTLRLATLNDEGFFVFEKLPLDKNYMFLLDTKDTELMDEIYVLIIDEKGEETIITASRDSENLFRYEFLPEYEVMPDLDIEEAEELAIIEEEIVADTLSIDTSAQIVSMVEEPAIDTLSADTLSEELAIIEEDESEGEGESEEDSPTPVPTRGREEPTREKPSIGSAKFEGVVKSNGLALQDVSLKLLKGTDVINEIKTSENGEFAFDIIPGDDYSVFITKDGYVDRFSEISGLSGDIIIEPIGEGITHTSYVREEPIREKPSMASTKFQGNVTINGLGTQEVLVKLLKGPEVINEIKTSENGEFSFDIIQGADYSVLITKDGYLDKFYEISTIPKDNEIITKTFELENLPVRQAGMKL